MSDPVIKEITDTKTDLEVWKEKELPKLDKQSKKLIENFPIVYVHNWKNCGEYEVYVGETNDFFSRTKQHYDKRKAKNKWQNNLIEKNNPKLFVIGHDHFNKSLTLDVEDRLMHYLMGVSSVQEVHNRRENPQGSYYPSEEFDEIFSKIWKSLGNKNRALFPNEEEVKNSAIFKASPFHKLTEEQEKAKNFMLEEIRKALNNKKKKHQLIFIEGEAGTGKTVLNSSTFYELFNSSRRTKKKFNCHLIVNHDQQLTVYKQMMKKLGMKGEFVWKPTRFINEHKSGKMVDVAFVDEAHLLLTQGKQSYTGNNQLEDIINRSRVTIVMFDENQILKTEQYWEAQLLDKYKEQAKKQNKYFELKNQLRMRADKETLDWIDTFTKERKITPLPKQKQDGYEIKILDSPLEVDMAIIEKAKNPNTTLSRIVATYDWDYKRNDRPDSRLQTYWEVAIGDWKKPWNYEKEKEQTKAEKKKNKELSWAEQKHTIEEIGSTFSIQGFDLNYVGVILGPSVKFRNGEIVFDPNKSSNKKATQNRTLSDGTVQNFGEILIQHEVRVLMTRGVNGMYIYACDDALQNELKKAAKIL